MPRFAGGTRGWWPVLNHLYVTELIVSEMLEGKARHYRASCKLYALIHDLHEAYTGDVPTPFKTFELKARQRQIDAGLYSQVLGIPRPPNKYAYVVKLADHRAFAAEAAVMGGDWWPADAEYDPSCLLPKNGDMKVVEYIHDRYGSPTQTCHPDGDAVRDYVQAVREGIKLL